MLWDNIIEEDASLAAPDSPLWATWSTRDVPEQNGHRPVTPSYIRSRLPGRCSHRLLHLVGSPFPPGVDPEGSLHIVTIQNRMF